MTHRNCIAPPPLHVVESTPAPPDPDGDEEREAVGSYAAFAGVIFLGAWVVAIVVLGGARLLLGAFR